jgi:formate dehydrogenase maturation protein FdhE
MEKTIEDYDYCEYCGHNISWMAFRSTCVRCEEEMNDEYEPGERDEDLFWDEGM